MSEERRPEDEMNEVYESNELNETIETSETGETSEASDANETGETGETGEASETGETSEAGEKKAGFAQKAQETGKRLALRAGAAVRAALAAFASLNLPNKLTLLRVALVPVYLFLLALSDWPWLTLLVFVAASLTDLLDGYIARKRELVTNFGKFMDPIADKLLTHTAFILLCAMGRLNVVACILFIGREFVVSGLRLVAVEQGLVIAAGMSGKVKTVLQMALVMALTLRLNERLPLAAALLTVAAVAATLYSMGEYVWRNRAVLGGAR